MHVSYNMHVIDCKMPFTCVTFRIGIVLYGNFFLAPTVVIVV